MRHGVRLGIDVGQVRIGVARSDAAGIMALPVRTVKRDGRDLAQIQRIAREFDAMEIVVGLPLGMSGTEGESARRAREYAGRIAERVGLPVRLVDERLSTVSAHTALADAGRGSRSHRAVVDQVAATVILDHALATERSTGEPPGEQWKGQQ